MADTAYYIEVKTPTGAIWRVYCFAQELSIGRAPDNDLVVPDSRVKDYEWRIYFAQAKNQVGVSLDDLSAGSGSTPWVLDVPSRLGKSDYSLTLKRKPGIEQPQTSIDPQGKDGFETLSARLLYWGYWLRGGLQNAWMRFIIYGCTLLGIGMLVPFLLRIDEQNWAAAAEPVVATPTQTSTPTVTSTLIPTPTASPTWTATPSATPSPTATPVPTATPTPTLTPQPDTGETLNRGGNLATWGLTPVAVTVAVGAEYWKLDRVERWTGSDAEGRQGIMVEVVGADGKRDLNQSVQLLGTELQPLDSRATNDKPSNYDHACQFPMFNPPPATYGVFVQGLPSERVQGLALVTQNGVPVNTGYLIIFRRTRR